MTRILLVLFTISAGLSYGQGELSYTFTLLDYKGKAMPNVAVKFTNTISGAVLTLSTNLQGIVQTKFKSSDGLSYTLSFLDHENELTLTVPEDGIRTMSKKLTYIPKSALLADEPADRSGKSFKEISLPKEGSSTVIITLADDLSMPVFQEVKVILTDVDAGLQYKPVKGLRGKYVFYVKPGRSYEVDVDGLSCLTKVNLSAESCEMSKTLPYVLSNVKESFIGDTVYQSNANTANTSINRMKYIVSISDYSGNPLADEPVFLKSLTTKAVFAGKTDSQGKLAFQLPKTSDYIINLKYETNLRKVDCMRAKNVFSEGSINFSNRGYLAIEKEQKAAEEERKQAAIKAIEDAKEQATQAKIAEQMQKDRVNQLKLRDAQVYSAKQFKSDFNQTPIKPYNSAQIKVERTPHGFKVDAGSGSSVGSPVLVGNNVLASGGYYSPIIYSFNPGSGTVNWSVALAESGPSALVYQDGVILIYTESCTLYALDAIAGTLLWSKWLTHMVYSSPSAGSGQVVAVYNDELGHVAICMDIKTGKINWQRPLDSECLGAPVLAGGKVHLTTLGGMLHVFDLTTGAVTKRLNINAVSSPTLSFNALYITHKDELGKEKIGMYAVPGYQLVKDMDVLGALTDIPSNSGGNMTGMTYQGTRLLGYKGLSYFLGMGKLNCLDPVMGKILWTQSLRKSNTYGTMQPLALENMIAIGHLDGMVSFYDYKKGNKLMEYNLLEPLGSTPIIANNTIYAGSENGKLIVYKIDKPVKSFGTMWGGNAAHNVWIQ